MPAVVEDWSALLDRMQFQADPLADRTVARALGELPATDSLHGGEALMAAFDEPLARTALVTRLIAQWRHNGELADWQPDLSKVPTSLPADTVADVVAALQDYLRQACPLPHWADRQRILRAEELFFLDGPLSVLMLFCASLPQCYVVPDLAEVLHVSGQLEQHTEYRIRATGAMIFPVMMKGGLTQARGMGVAQVLKVRLIHATIRHLILRGNVEQAVAALGGEGFAAGQGVVPPLAALAAQAVPGPQQMHLAMLAHGWRLGDDGLPCNQEEMAYTLLTFGYVALAGLRTLGLPYSREDEQAMLHAWNVMGHYTGIQPELMVHSMEEAQPLFELMQARGRAKVPQPDPRPNLGRTLMAEMGALIPFGPAKAIPQLLTQRLCGPATARDIGVDTPVPLASRLLYGVGNFLITTVDALLITFFGRNAALGRLLTRHLGYRAVSRFLLNQTRPLKLPQHLLGQVDETVKTWRR